MSKNIPVKDRVAARLDRIRILEGEDNYSDLIEMILDKVEPLLESDK